MTLTIKTQQRKLAERIPTTFILVSAGALHDEQFVGKFNTWVAKRREQYHQLVYKSSPLHPIKSLYGFPTKSKSRQSPLMKLRSRDWSNDRIAISVKFDNATLAMTAEKPARKCAALCAELTGSASTLNNSWHASFSPEKKGHSMKTRGEIDVRRYSTHTEAHYSQTLKMICEDTLHKYS